jgi:hypothetical protein
MQDRSVPECEGIPDGVVLPEELEAEIQALIEGYQAISDRLAADSRKFAWHQPYRYMY